MISENTMNSKVQDTTPKKLGPKAKILIADDHELFRIGLKTLIEKDPSLAFIGEAADGQELETLLESTSPDLIIVDYIMPGCSGLETILKIRTKYPFLKALILTNLEEETLQKAAYEGNLNGYVFKTEPKENISKAIHEILEGKTFYSRKNWSSISESALTENNPFQKLTKRELEIVTLISQGNTQKQIADTLGISIKTLEIHRSHINQKLGKVTIAELVRLSYLWGIVKEPGMISSYQ